jgi:hypothetical protein
MIFNNQIITIKKGGTFPLIQYNLNDYILKKYNITESMLENVAITFSMMNSDGYKVANQPGRLVINDGSYEDLGDVKYMLTFKLSEYQTNKPGRYDGEFVIDFLDDSGYKLKLPTTGYINILITDSITNTTVL